jgi:uncharacterized protein YjaG (DUF416 family)
VDALELPQFNKAALVRRLRAMAPRLRVAFGAACAERLLPQYESFVKETGWGDARRIGEILDRVWDHALGVDPAQGEIERLLAECKSLIPDADEFRTRRVGTAQDAAMAVYAAIQTLQDSAPENAARAPGFAIDAVDALAQEAGSIGPMDPQRESKILRHSVMQGELHCQQKDLEILEQGGVESVRSLRASVLRR